VALADITPIGRSIDQGILRAALDLLRLFLGGLWVGGQLSLYADRLAFEPNELNRRYSDGTLSVTITLASVTDVRTHFGLSTGIIEVAQGATSSRFRCFGSKAFSERIAAAASAAGANLMRR
jgi:hypothetical protein